MEGHSGVAWNTQAASGSLALDESALRIDVGDHSATSCRFPDVYPSAAAPSLRFCHPVWHPLVNRDSGTLDISNHLPQTTDEVSAVYILNLLPR